MKKSLLQEISNEVIVECKLPKDEMKQLLYQINNEATKYELMSLLIDGEFPSEKMTKEQEEIMEARFNSIEIDPLFSELINEQGGFKKLGGTIIKGTGGAVKGIGGAFKNVGKGVGGAADRAAGKTADVLNMTPGQAAKAGAIGAAKRLLVLWLVYRGIKALFSQKARRCGVLGFGKKRQHCMYQVKMETFKKEMNTLMQIKSLCKNQKNANNCNAKVDSKISKLKQDMAETETKMRQLEAQGKASAGPANTVKLI